MNKRALKAERNSKGELIPIWDQALFSMGYDGAKHGGYLAEYQSMLNKGGSGGYSEDAIGRAKESDNNVSPEDRLKYEERLCSQVVSVVQNKIRNAKTRNGGK